MSAEQIIRRFNALKNLRSTWEGLWQDCYKYALPGSNPFLAPFGYPGTMGDVYDSTAADAVEELAGVLVHELTPETVPWIHVQSPSAEDADRIRDVLMQEFSAGGLYVALHGAAMESIITGTGILCFEEGDRDGDPHFRFSAATLGNTVLEEGAFGVLDSVRRLYVRPVSWCQARWPGVRMPDPPLVGDHGEEPCCTVVEEVVPEDGGYRHRIAVAPNANMPSKAVMVADGTDETSPYIAFRWGKAPIEQYGRGPVMKTLPDIKTANKVVEFVLKNAALAVGGLWQAEDDGVLNPSGLKISPGTIVPIGMGSKGLQPIEAPGRFDVSQLILSDLRNRIRHALLVDQLTVVPVPRMTATEVLERSAKLARVLGSVYARLIVELLDPLVRRAFLKLQRRGVLPPMPSVDVDYLNPITIRQRHENAQRLMLWVSTAQGIGTDGAMVVRQEETVRYLGGLWQVPGMLMKDADEVAAERQAETARRAAIAMSAAAPAEQSTLAEPVLEQLLG
jgi:hypothetical protein